MLPNLPQAAIPLRLQGPGRQPSDARPRKHGGAGLAEGRADRTHCACADASLLAPPTSLAALVSLALAGGRRSLAIAGAPFSPGPSSVFFFSRLSAWSRLSCQASSASGRLGAVVPKEGPAGIAMGKSDFLTPKAIANRIKSKGLQKLRWYCQMCQKQCRDEVSGAGSGPGPWGAGCEALGSAAHPCAVSFLPRVGGTDVAKGLECYCR